MLYQPASPLLALVRRLLGPPSDAPIDDGAPMTESSALLAAVPSAPRTISPAGVALIKRFEGCARLRSDGLVVAYPDPGTGAEPWTIGWGATGRDHIHGGRIGPDTVWTQGQCDERLAQDLRRYAADVARALGEAPTSQPQFDAMVSFHYNTGGIAKAALTRHLNVGNRVAAADAFLNWRRPASIIDSR